MSAFTLDPRLRDDCEVLHESSGISYLLHRNAEVSWFILVPHTEETEFYQLGVELQQQLCTEIKRVSEFIQGHFNVDKLNVASIGNVVAQMHLHVIGRRHDDAYWPGVVWGQPATCSYTDTQIDTIRAQLKAFLDSK